MSGTRGKRKVGKAYSKRTKRSADIYLNTDSGTFTARVVGYEGVIEAQTLKDCERQAIEALDRSMCDFVQRIVIDAPHREPATSGYLGGYHTSARHMTLGASVSFDFHRLEIGVTPEGTKVERPFLIDGLTEAQVDWLDGKDFDEDTDDGRAKRVRLEEQRKRFIEENAEARAAGKDVDEHSSHRYERENLVEIPYSPEVWAVLLEMRAQMVTLSEKLTTILKNAETTLPQLARSGAVKLALPEPQQTGLSAPRPTRKVYKK